MEFSVLDAEESIPVSCSLLKTMNYLKETFDYLGFGIHSVQK
jgi:hypothetical protein